mgnify:CR=1 FL=1|jgi:hypothetical protein
MRQAIFNKNVILSLFELFCVKIAVFRGGHNCCNKFRDN